MTLRDKIHSMRALKKTSNNGKYTKSGGDGIKKSTGEPRAKLTVGMGIICDPRSRDQKQRSSRPKANDKPIRGRITDIGKGAAMELAMGRLELKKDCIMWGASHLTREKSLRANRILRHKLLLIWSICY